MRSRLEGLSKTIAAAGFALTAVSCVSNIENISTDEHGDGWQNDRSAIARVFDMDRGRYSRVVEPSKEFPWEGRHAEAELIPSVSHMGEKPHAPRNAREFLIALLGDEVGFVGGLGMAASALAMRTRKEL